MSACDGESRAERLHDKAVRHVDEGKLEEAIALYQEVIDRYPETNAADHALYLVHAICE